MTLPPPYRGLDQYREEDAPLFFGRERDCRLLIANILAAPLTLLYGPTGVGKSSLIHAGLTPALRSIAQRAPRMRLRLVTCKNWRDDALNNLKHEIAVSIGEDIFDGAAPFGERVALWSEHTQQQMLLVLDQFEEYFVYHPNPQADRFVREFAAAVQLHGASLSILLVMREDALARLDCFKGKIENIFANYFRLMPLTRGDGARAICEPLKCLNRLFPQESPYAIDEELVRTVLNEVRLGRIGMGSETGKGGVQEDEEHIEAAYLQLVMKRIWDEEEQASSRHLHIATLHRLGSTERIVKEHVDHVMYQLRLDAQDLAAQLFNYLVTPSGTKVAYTVADLSFYTGMPEGLLRPVLDRLASGDNRILTAIPSPDPDRVRFEIFHDILGAAILSWRSEHHEQTQHGSQLAFLSKITEELAARELDTDSWVRLILTGMTAGYGLRFNTALVFLQTMHGDLVGAYGVGTLAHEEAMIGWQRMRSWTPEQLIDVTVSGHDESAMSTFIKRVRVSSGAESTLLRFVTQPETYAILSAVELTDVDRRALGDPNDDVQILILPIHGREHRVLGIVAVDNRFTQHPIHNDDIFGLTLLTSLAAMALERSPVP
jgi:hypothetical protein